MLLTSFYNFIILFALFYKILLIKVLVSPKIEDLTLKNYV